MHPAEKPTITYRPDIDGLRALAVLLAVGFHAFPASLPGGFLGVDIFFVISGYLISWIILSDLERGCFSFRDFYARRIRRIFPALAVVLAAVLVAGWFLLLPDEYAALGKHILGGASFVSNVLLWLEAGYFDAAAKAKPLLHLWSLGIEEQYYIFFPLLLWACARQHVRAATVIITLGLLSFMDNMYLHRIDTTAEFYSPLARIWELLAGAALCTVMRQASTRRAYLQLDAFCSRLIWQTAQTNDGRSLSLMLGWTGLVLIGIGLLLARQTDPWPSWKALLPVTGTICLIAAGPLNSISRYLLCNRLAVFVGRVSYPFYLWHWPLISLAFISMGHLDASTRLLRLGLVFLAFILAVLTHYLIEKPIRFNPRQRRVKTLVCIYVMMLLGSAGYYLWQKNGMPERPHFKEVAAQLQQLKHPPLFNEEGLKYAGISKNILLYCRYTDAGAASTVAIIGDSHANSAYSGIAELGLKSGYNTVLLGWMVPGGNIWDSKKSHDMETVFRILQNKSDITKIFISTRGMIYITGIQNTGHKGNPIHNNTPIGNKYFKEDLQNIVNRLSGMGKDVFIIGENPELPADPRDYISRQGDNDVKQFPPCHKADVMSRQRPYLDILEEITGAIVIDTIDAFCPKEKCMAFDGKGVPLYYDDDHLSQAGSAFQAEYILKPYLINSLP